MMDIGEAKIHIKHFQNVVRYYTDVLLSLSKNRQSGKYEIIGLGSCVHLLYKDHGFSISCSHVAHCDCMYFTNPKQLQCPRVPDGLNSPVQNITLLGRDAQLDLALFNSNGLSIESNGKNRFDISKSTLITEASLSSSDNKDLLSYIHGVWGDESTFCYYADGIYMNSSLYTALGPIKEVTPEVIVADFAEKENLLESNYSNHNEKMFELTGGSRDISGCSGSGLWINPESPILAGILHSRKPAPDDQHLVAFTPVWRVIEFIDKTLKIINSI